ncbi:MAG: hypothetical protein ACYTGZ_22090 [Planctomycetota bacterium]
MSANRITRALLGLLVLGSGVLLAAHATPAADAVLGTESLARKKKPVTVPFTVIAEGQYSNIDAPLQAAVRDQDAWDALWAMHAGGNPPAVDFGQDMVVAVFLGMRATPRFSVYIDTVTPLEGGSYLVSYVEQEIRSKRVFSDIMTTPYAMAVVPRTDAAVWFEGTKVIVKRDKRNK